MIVLEIDSVKEFMQHMFQGSMFDRFHLRSCEVTTFATFHIDGRCFDDWLTVMKNGQMKPVWLHGI